MKTMTKLLSSPNGCGFEFFGWIKLVLSEFCNPVGFLNMMCELSCDFGSTGPQLKNALFKSVEENKIDGFAKKRTLSSVLEECCFPNIAWKKQDPFSGNEQKMGWKAEFADCIVLDFLLSILDK